MDNYLALPKYADTTHFPPELRTQITEKTPDYSLNGQDYCLFPLPLFYTPTHQHLLSHYIFLETDVENIFQLNIPISAEYIAQKAAEEERRQAEIREAEERAEAQRREQIAEQERIRAEENATYHERMNTELSTIPNVICHNKQMDTIPTTPEIHVFTQAVEESHWDHSKIHLKHVDTLINRNKRTALLCPTPCGGWSVQLLIKIQNIKEFSTTLRHYFTPESQTEDEFLNNTKILSTTNQNAKIERLKKDILKSQERLLKWRCEYKRNQTIDEKNKALKDIIQNIKHKSDQKITQLLRDLHHTPQIKHVTFSGNHIDPSLPHSLRAHFQRNIPTAHRPYTLKLVIHKDPLDSLLFFLQKDLQSFDFLMIQAVTTKTNTIIDLTTPETLHAARECFNAGRPQAFLRRLIRRANTECQEKKNE